MNQLLFVILAALLPPVAVFIKTGICKELYLNLFLCLAAYIPAIVHAIWIVRGEYNTLNSSPAEFDGTDHNDQDANRSSRIEPRLDW